MQIVTRQEIIKKKVNVSSAYISNILWFTKGNYQDIKNYKVFNIILT